MSAAREHRVHRPADLAAALAFLAEHADEGWLPVAGGTDLMVSLDRGRAPATRWLDVWGIRREIAAIGKDEDGRVRVGGGATMTELRASDALRALCPMIAEAAATVGARQIQNRATVAGNIANASPAGDTLPVWLALDAEIELVSAAGVRRVPYREFTPEYRKTLRRPDELIGAVVFDPPVPGTRFRFRKVGTRAAQAISKVVFAGAARTDAEGALVSVRLAFGSVAPVPFRARTAEAAVLGRRPSPEAVAAAASALRGEISPIDDVRSTARYRIHVAEGVLRGFLFGLPDLTPG